MQALTITDIWKSIDRTNQVAYVAEVEMFLSQPSIQTILDRIHDVDDSSRLNNTQALVPHSPIGYVYAAWNPLFADLIKIGATRRDHPYARVMELSSATGVPEPFQLVSFIPCQHPFILEKAIHRYYESARKYGRKKEFFLLSRDEIIEHFHLRCTCDIMVSVNEEFRQKMYYGQPKKDSAREKVII